MASDRVRKRIEFAIEKLPTPIADHLKNEIQAAHYLTYYGGWNWELD